MRAQLRAAELLAPGVSFFTSRGESGEVACGTTRAATLPNHLPATVVKRRARELRALGESKAAGFRRSQIGRTLRVLTLRPNDDDPTGDSTPALSSNYLRMRIRGLYPANLWLEVLTSMEEGNCLLAVPAASPQ